MKKAVFLDRDGVINRLVFNPGTGEFEPPHDPADLSLFPGVIRSLHSLADAGFDLFIVSNQPDYAKGKTTLEQIKAVHKKLEEIFTENNIHFREFYYCYHHPDGVVPEYSYICECRKPKPYFLLKAAEDYGTDLSQSWMIGDRDSDIECGKNAGTRTILIKEPHSSDKRGKSNPDFYAENIEEAKNIILKFERPSKRV
ncbi:D-glycero-D-manno-heptose 1,7-bisphosphate phosphatase [Methanomicrobium sp. W14]|uniref:D-glycero-alpha-D-manno-heptose-1,7-bisphosphate 7-phosphatase n=1 Tax=Methanomicrobium sp. W14 TaxID=2817839 RepID=UPI001AE997C5|nr:HAD family hydrolase [Methanomicrobium sp. W14]MBP2134440.1 D-glycero-D-manno-heptose 1,7-bisphosphate phosphatase [Methanomicrobium sp. W14]